MDLLGNRYIETGRHEGASVHGYGFDLKRKLLFYKANSGTDWTLVGPREILSSVPEGAHVYKAHGSTEKRPFIVLEDGSLYASRQHTAEK